MNLKSKDKDRATKFHLLGKTQTLQSETHRNCWYCSWSAQECICQQPSSMISLNATVKSINLVKWNVSKTKPKVMILVKGVAGRRRHDKIGVRTERGRGWSECIMYSYYMTTKQLNKAACKISCCPSPINKEPDYSSLELKDSSKVGPWI